MGNKVLRLCFHFAMFVYLPTSSWSQTNVGMLMTFTLSYLPPPPPPTHTHTPHRSFFNAIYMLISPFLRYSPDQHPVLAFKGAPARFPVLPKHRHLQQYLKWSKMKNAEADEYINNTIGDVPYLAIHLRMGIDWVGCSSSHSYTLLNVHCTPSVKPFKNWQTKLEKEWSRILHIQGCVLIGIVFAHTRCAIANTALHPPPPNYNNSVRSSVW